MKPDTSVLVRVIQGRRAAVLCQSTCIGLCQGYSSQNCRVCECACECVCVCVSDEGIASSSPAHARGALE